MSVLETPPAPVAERAIAIDVSLDELNILYRGLSSEKEADSDRLSTIVVYETGDDAALEKLKAKMRRLERAHYNVLVARGNSKFRSPESTSIVLTGEELFEIVEFEIARSGDSLESLACGRFERDEKSLDEWREVLVKTIEALDFARKFDPYKTVEDLIEFKLNLVEAS